MLDFGASDYETSVLEIRQHGMSIPNGYVGIPFKVRSSPPPR
jgi:hypothetical protein